MLLDVNNSIKLHHDSHLMFTTIISSYKASSSDTNNP